MRWLAKSLGIILWTATKWGPILLLAKGTWTFFKSLAEGMTVTQAMIWSAAAFGAGLLLVVGVFYALDYLAGRLPEVIGRRKVSALFREMALHGKHDAIPLTSAVHFWMGKKPETAIELVQADFKLHHLKAAIGQGLLQAQGPGGRVVATTLCRPADLADFFGSWRWLFVKDELWRGATYEGQSQ